MSISLLIADDENFIRQAYKDGFERAGFSVRVAADGVEALAMLHESTPDALLLDLIMPKADGFEVLKTIKADPAFAAMPVLVLSNLSQESDEAEVRDLGAIDFIVKSDYSLKQVIERVKVAVGSDATADQ